MKLKGKRSQLGDHYDTELGCFTDGYMINCKGAGVVQLLLALAQSNVEY